MPRYIGAYRGGVRPSAPTTVYRTCALSLPCHSEPVTDVTGVGIRPPSPPSQREVSRPKAVTEGEICRGIRGDAPQGYLFRFAPLRGHRPLRTVYRKRMRIPPGGQCRPPLHPVSQRQMHYQNQTSGQRPLPTFAALRQRRDLIIAQTPGGCFQRGRAAALPLWSLKDGGFSRGKEDRNFLPP